MLLLNGDCLELMKTLPDKSIDLFLCDLPYGCLTGGAGKEKAKRIANVANRYRKECPPTDRGERTLSDGTVAPAGIFGCTWDVKIDLEQFWAQVERLMKDDHTPILHFCNARFGYELIKSKEDWFRYDLVWDKTIGVSFLQANKMPMRSHELIYVFSKKGARYYRKDVHVEGAKEWKQFGKVGVSGVYDLVRENPVIRPVGTITSQAGIRCVKSVIPISNKKGKGKHPTQKPDDLYAWLLERYSKEGDTILDPTAGSFASVFTAEKMGRKGIGIEKDVAFYTKANELSAR